ncbi:MAG TPA: hypothetical protein VFR95_10975 [Gemmatimonadaceae bacterium]|nr:hypothetical protein [Gemmatimonadaceae bacterium]
MASRRLGRELRALRTSIAIGSVVVLALSVCKSAPASDDGTASSPRLASLQPVVIDAAPPAVLEASEGGATRAEFRNVDFHMTPDVVLDIHYLDGAMKSVVSGQPVVFDEKSSFVIQIDTARVGLTSQNLDALMNRYVFAYKGAPLRNLRFEVKDSQLVQSGVLHKVVNIPFRITAALSVTNEGLVRIHPVAIRIFDVDGEGLMKALGIQLQDLLDLRRARGVTVQGNDLLLNASQLLPPPAISGRVVAARVENGEVVQIFGRDSMNGSGTDGVGSPPPSVRDSIPPLDSSATNFLRFKGGTLRFGRLFMVDADMQIIDKDQHDPFDFSIDDYNRQLVAGYSRNTVAGALKVFMPDLDDIGASHPN